MKKQYVMNSKYLILGLITALTLFNCCTEFPMDEDDMLITTQTRCYIGNFYLYGPDHIDCLIPDSTAIDTVNLTITGMARFGTNLKNVKPVASLSLDSKIEPAMGVWTDFTVPKNYTVISGNRKIRKEYTISIKLQGE